MSHNRSCRFTTSSKFPKIKNTPLPGVLGDAEGVGVRQARGTRREAESGAGGELRGAAGLGAVLLRCSFPTTGSPQPPSASPRCVVVALLCPCACASVLLRFPGGRGDFNCWGEAAAASHKVSNWLLLIVSHHFISCSLKWCAATLGTSTCGS